MVFFFNLGQNRICDNYCIILQDHRDKRKEKCRVEQSSLFMIQYYKVLSKKRDLVGRRGTPDSVTVLRTKLINLYFNY